MDELKIALRRLAKAVVVITSMNGGARCVMSATAVSELSFDPPSMLVCVNQTASLFPALHGGAPFAVNILDCSQADIAQRCAGSVKGEARFDEGRWEATSLGVPRLLDAQANIVCVNAGSFHHGTHGIFIGNVSEVFTNGSPNPLIYLDGQYTRQGARI